MFLWKNVFNSYESKKCLTAHLWLFKVVMVLRQVPGTLHRIVVPFLYQLKDPLKPIDQTQQICFQLCIKIICFLC